VTQALRTHHLGFSVADLDLAVELIRPFGFEEVTRLHAGGDDMARGNDLPGASADIALLKRGTLMIELLDFEDKIPPAFIDTSRAWVRLPVSNASWTNFELGMVARRLEPGATSGTELRRVLDLAGLPIVAEEGSRSGELRPIVYSPVADLLGAGELYKWLGFAGTANGTRFERDDLVIELEPNSAGEDLRPSPNTIGRMHIAVEVALIEEVWADLDAAGFSFVSRPIRSDGPIWWAFLREPLGAGVELVDVTTA
jgi:catechol 2,3-dioxygenase-like lactoylglutathione lyase family enzyme